MADTDPRDQQMDSDRKRENNLAAMIAEIRRKHPDRKILGPSGVPWNAIADDFECLLFQLSALRARQQALEQALHEALEGWAYAVQYICNTKATT